MRRPLHCVPVSVDFVTARVGTFVTSCLQPCCQESHHTLYIPTECLCLSDFQGATLTA